MPVDPRGKDLKRYMKEDPGGPVVMLNLLKYQPAGEQSYPGVYRGSGELSPQHRR